MVAGNSTGVCLATGLKDLMGKEIEKIRKNLTCGHCQSTFEGSIKQAYRVRSESKTVYCSTTCRHTAMSKKYRKPLPFNGVCKQCDKPFASKIKKIFCSLDCYIASDDLKESARRGREKSLSKESREKIAKAHRTGSCVECLECKKEIWSKPSENKKFCSQTCYRSYRAKRFDRWIANPEQMALPQNYDEFLDRDELPCVVEGCHWKGVHLTAHMNEAHGISADEFKRAAGFNLGTGVIAKPLAEKLQDRPLQGVAINPVPIEQRKVKGRKNIRYRSKEGNEHGKKARALKLLEGNPIRVCKSCGANFEQSTPYGKALYCSISCREDFYRQQRQDRPKKERARNGKGQFVWVNPENNS